MYLYYKSCICQGEWTRNSRFVAPNLRGAIAPSRFGCDESTCFASILRLKMHSDVQLVILFLQLIQMHMITSEVGRELSINSCLSVCRCVSMFIRKVLNGFGRNFMYGSP